MSQPKNLKRQFWVTNTLPNKDVSLADLALTIRAGESRNLLDSRRYKYTIEQLEQSRKTGSISKKSPYVKVRDVAPVVNIKPGLYLAKGPYRVGQQLRSTVEINNPRYAELDGEEREDKQHVEEAFASEYADAAAYDDHRPLLAVDKRYNGKVEDEEEK